MFAAVTADGRLELWDFAVSTLRPVCQHAVTKTAMTALLFAKVSQAKGIQGDDPAVDCSPDIMLQDGRTARVQVQEAMCHTPSSAQAASCKALSHGTLALHHVG